MPKLNSTQVGRAAEHFVVAEIHRRGGHAACFGGNMPKIDVLASKFDQSRRVTIQVKAKFGGSGWQTDTKHGSAREAEPDDETCRYWVLVDPRTEPPTYYVMPEWWIQNNIYETHADYLERNGGLRLRGGTSSHHGINMSRVEQWHDRWDLLGIFLLDQGPVSTP